MRPRAVPDVVKVLVFGAGAIGSLIGGLLSIENEVTLVTRKAHADVINRRGLRISGTNARLVHPTAMTEVPVETPDLIFVTTKAYDTANAADALRAFSRRTPFVTLQNGLGNAETLAAKADRVIAGTTSHGVMFAAAGEIVHAGVGDTVVGPFAGSTRAEAERIANELTTAGISTRVVDDVRPELWTKAAVNAAINPLTAVLRVPNGVLVQHQDLRTLMERLAREATLAAEAAGIPLDAERIAAKAVEVATQTAENRSSMLQDVERGRRTEIDAISGAVLRAAGTGGQILPYTQTAYALVKGLERSLAR